MAFAGVTFGEKQQCVETHGQRLVNLRSFGSVRMPQEHLLNQLYSSLHSSVAMDTNIFENRDGSLRNLTLKIFT